jgi:hypothetical protein
MRAAVLVGPGQARVDEVGCPEPGPSQVRVRLEGSGVCAVVPGGMARGLSITASSDRFR